MVENEEISADEASVTIDLIVEIKQDLLDGAKKDEVSPKLRQLKAALKDLRLKANAEAEANE